MECVKKYPNYGPQNFQLNIIIQPGVSFLPLREYLQSSILPFVNRPFSGPKQSVNSVTRLGDFLKFWVKNYVTKVAKMYSDFWAILKISRFR